MSLVQPLARPTMTVLLVVVTVPMVAVRLWHSQPVVVPMNARLTNVQPTMMEQIAMRRPLCICVGNASHNPDRHVG
jgi:hypothetical protein